MEIWNTNLIFVHALDQLYTMLECVGEDGDIGIVSKWGEQLYGAFDVMLWLISPYIFYFESKWPLVVWDNLVRAGRELGGAKIMYTVNVMQEPNYDLIITYYQCKYI